MYNDQDNFINAIASMQLLSQLLGPKRFYIFAEEARENLQRLTYSVWSPEFLADYVSNELRKPQWQGRQPSVLEYQKMVVNSRRICREYEIQFPASQAGLKLHRVKTVDDFDFAKVMTLDLLDYYSGNSSSNVIPPVYAIMKGRKLYSEIQVTLVLSGVLVDIVFCKPACHKDEKAN